MDLKHTGRTETFEASHSDPAPTVAADSKGLPEEWVLGFSAGDPATWPESMQARRLQVIGHLGDCMDDGAAERDPYSLRRDLALEVAVYRAREEYAFFEAAMSELMNRLPADTAEGALIRALEGEHFGLMAHAIDAYMEIAPKLDALLPRESWREVLRALQTE